MYRGGERRKQQTTAPSAKGVCCDRLPHLRRNFTTCTNACTQPYGHRPETPHRCANGHEWYLDEASRDLRKSDSFHANPNEKGENDVNNRAQS